MYAQPFESLYNTNHPIDVCFLLLSVREGLEKGLTRIYPTENMRIPNQHKFFYWLHPPLLLDVASAVACLLNMYAEIGRYLRPLGKLSLT